MERNDILFWVVALTVIVIGAVTVAYLFPQLTSWLTPG